MNVFELVFDYLMDFPIQFITVGVLILDSDRAGHLCRSLWPGVVVACGWLPWGLHCCCVARGWRQVAVRGAVRTALPLHWRCPAGCIARTLG